MKLGGINQILIALVVGDLIGLFFHPLGWLIFIGAIVAAFVVFLFSKRADSSDQIS